MGHDFFFALLNTSTRHGTDTSDCFNRWLISEYDFASIMDVSATSPVRKQHFNDQSRTPGFDMLVSGLMLRYIHPVNLLSAKATSNGEIDFSSIFLVFFLFFISCSGSPGCISFSLLFLSLRTRGWDLVVAGRTRG